MISFQTAKLRINEGKAKGKLVFYFAFASASNFGEANVTYKREKSKRKTRFLLSARSDDSVV